MLRKIVQTDDSGELVLDLPKNLQGKQIEVIAFAVGEEDTIQKKPASFFAGTLSDEDAEELLNHVNDSGKKWGSPYENE